MGYLIFKSAGPTKPVEIGDAGVVVGRAPECDVPVQDTQLSRKHCRFFTANAKAHVEDLGSANGTTVNGHKIATATVLNPGDIVQFGTVTLVFSLDPTDPPTDIVGGKGGPHLKLRNGVDGLTIPPTLPLSKDRLTLGRKPGNDIIIKATIVSGQHCEFVREGETFRVRDLGSTNGVKINGEKVDSAALNPGDVIAIDTLVFVYQDPDRAPKQSPAKLEVIEGDLGTKDIVLGRATISFGRKPGNTFAIKDDTEISSQHAKIYRDDATGRYMIVDLGSTNGTRVDGSRLDANTPITLGNGSKIRMGGIILGFVDPTAPPAQRTSTRSSSSSTKKSSARPAPPSDDIDLGPSDTLDEEVMFDNDSLGAEMTLDADTPSDAAAEGNKPRGGKSRRSGRPGASATPASAADPDASFEDEAKQFLAGAKGKKKSRTVQTAIEAAIVVCIIGVGVFALVTASQSVPVITDSGERAIPTPSGSKLQTNWSFEQADETTGLPLGWDLADTQTDAAYRTANQAKSGAASLEISRVSTDYSSTDVISADLIAVSPGHSVAAKAAVYRVEGTAAGALKIEFFRDALGTQFLGSLISEAISSPQTWADVTLSAVLPDEAKAVRVACVALGGQGKIAFDDVTVSTDATAGDSAVSAGQSATIGVGDLAWEVGPSGVFSLVRHTADGREILAGDLEPTFTLRPSGRPFARLSDLCVSRKITADASPTAPRITVAARVIEPHGPALGGKAPTNSVDLTLSFENGLPTVSIRAGRDTTVTETGLLVSVPGYRQSQPFARFVERPSARERILAFHRPARRAGQDDAFSFDSLVFPRGATGFVGLSMRGDAGGLATAVLDEATMYVSVRAAGTTFDLALPPDPNAAAIADFTRQADQAIQAEQYGTALAHTLRALQASLYDLNRIQALTEKVAAIMARLRYRIDEFTENMAALNINFSRERFIRTQAQMSELLAAIDLEAVADAPRGFLTAYSTGRVPAGASAADFEDSRTAIALLTRIWEDLNLLDSVPKTFEELSRTKRADVDAATLVRWEQEVRPLLARAIDYEQAQLPTMAIAAYRQVLELAPLSRPAAVARTALARLARALMTEADANARQWPTAALSKRYLAQDLALAIRREKWAEAEAFWNDKAVDPQSASPGSWATPRAAEFVRNFYQIEERAAVGGGNPAPPSWQTIWPDSSNPWWRWSAADWQAAERTARRDAEDILRRLSDLPPLPGTTNSDSADGD